MDIDALADPPRDDYLLDAASGETANHRHNILKPIREQLPPASATEVVACERVRGRDFGCQWHFHPEMEITLVLSGGSNRWVGDKISPLEPGDLTFLGSNLPHDFRNDAVPGKRPKPVNAITVQFHPAFLGGSWLEHAEMTSIQRLFQRASNGLQVTGQTRDRVEAMIVKLLGTRGVRRLILLLEIFGEMSESRELLRISSPGFAPEVHVSDSQQMALVSAFIQENIEKPIYLAEVARHLGMTDVTFSRYFRSRTGKTFPNYLNELRVARVCRLLAETDHTVSEIAWSCGFDSMANFQKQFGRIQGCTPKEYRRRTMGL